MIGEIEGDGFLEGGDFTPAGQDLSLLGIGLRSNMEAAQQLMDKDLLGSRRFAVVRDDFEQHQAGQPSPFMHCRSTTIKSYIEPALSLFVCSDMPFASKFGNCTSSPHTTSKHFKQFSAAM